MDFIFDFLLDFIINIFEFGTIPFYCLIAICMIGIVSLFRRLCYMNY